MFDMDRRGVLVIPVRMGKGYISESDIGRVGRDGMNANYRTATWTVASEILFPKNAVSTMR